MGSYRKEGPTHFGDAQQKTQNQKAQAAASEILIKLKEIIFRRRVVKPQNRLVRGAEE